jgi:hypothetical protein
MAERLTWNKPAWVAGIEPPEGPLFVITDGQGRYAFHRTVPQDDRFFLHCIADPALAERTLADKRRDIDPALRLEQLDFEAARGSRSSSPVATIRACSGLASDFSQPNPGC